MKKLLALLMAAALCVSIVACDSSEEVNPGRGEDTTTTAAETTTAATTEATTAATTTASGGISATDEAEISEMMNKYLADFEEFVDLFVQVGNKAMAEMDLEALELFLEMAEAIDEWADRSLEVIELLGEAKMEKELEDFNKAMEKAAEKIQSIIGE